MMNGDTNDSHSRLMLHVSIFLNPACFLATQRKFLSAGSCPMRRCSVP
jgi:hypothetical protein